MRTDQMNALLYNRPQKEELVQRGILAGGNRGGRRSSVVEQQRRSLENAMRRDNMNALLYSRASREELVARGILPGGSESRSGGIERQIRDLQNQMTKDKLGHLLEKRPSIHDLQYRGIYPEDFEFDYGDSGAHEEQKRPQLDQPQQEYLQRRSKNFHLTRILLKFVASMTQSGKITLDQKGCLKDLIVDQDKTILAVAETFDVENDVNDFEDSLVRLSSRNV